MLEEKIKKMLLVGLSSIVLSGAYLTGCGDDWGGGGGGEAQEGCSYNRGGINGEMVAGCREGQYCECEMRQTKENGPEREVCYCASESDNSSTEHGYLILE